MSKFLALGVKKTEVCVSFLVKTNQGPVYVYMYAYLHMYEGIWVTASLGFCTVNQNTLKTNGTLPKQIPVLCMATLSLWCMGTDSVSTVAQCVAGVYSKHTERYYVCV